MPEDGAYRGLVAWNRRVEIRYDRRDRYSFFRIAAFNQSLLKPRVFRADPTPEIFSGNDQAIKCRAQFHEAVHCAMFSHTERSFLHSG
jgi:hypothetical protein